MRELKFDVLSPDGTTLILVGKDGQKWSLVIDERIEAAVRRDRARIGQVEIEQAGVLRPREIQARIRSGATAEDVAAASGLSLEHVRRFEGPVLTERAWVAEQAQATEVRRPGGDIALGALVLERLEAEGVDPDDIVWDSWRRDDGTWVVIATFPLPPNTHVATWTYDSTSRTMTVVDDNARSLSAIDPDAPLRLSAARPALATVEPLTDDDEESGVVTSLPAWGRSTPDDDGTTPESELDQSVESDQRPDPSEDLSVDVDSVDVSDPSQPSGEATSGRLPSEGEGDVPDVDAPQAVGDDARSQEVAAEESEKPGPEESGSEEVGLFPTPNTVPKATRRPSVPSFDDILFGPGPGAPSH